MSADNITRDSECHLPEDERRGMFDASSIGWMDEGAIEARAALGHRRALIAAAVMATIGAVAGLVGVLW